MKPYMDWILLAQRWDKCYQPKPSKPEPSK